MADTEVVFDVNASRLGWTVLNKGWPDRLVVDKEGIVFFVEVKRKDEPLRPHQYRLMSLLESVGVKVFIAPDGDAEHLVPLDEWLVTASMRGRPSQIGTISRSTARSYMYKAKQLLAQAELGDGTAGFPRERVWELKARAGAMMRKAEQFWDGSDKDLLRDVTVMEKQSEKDLSQMMAKFHITNEEALKEVAKRKRLEQLANDELAAKAAQGGDANERRNTPTDTVETPGGSNVETGRLDK